MTAQRWLLRCPACQSDMGPMPDRCEEAACPRCAASWLRRDGIWRLMTEDGLQRYAPFLKDYTRIRLAEGRGSASSQYYLRLPGCDRDDPNAWQWKIRSRSFACLLRRLRQFQGRPLRILDLGAGVGWMSGRLQREGHAPCSLDVSVDGRDGLGAARHYQPQWPLLQAEFDRLPLADSQADVAVFNASFHYSVDFRRSLTEALRVLIPTGTLFVLDTPVYSDPQSGRTMMAERQADFERRFGTRSDSLPSRGFLSWSELDELAAQVGVEWRVHRPGYGWKWATRRWRERLRGRREPATFAVIEGARSASGSS